MKKVISLTIAITMGFLSIGFAFAIQRNNTPEFDGSLPLPAEKNLSITSISLNKNDLTKEWKKFKNDNNTWNINFDKLTNLPHRAFGKPLQIAGYNSVDETNINDAAKAFINQNKDLFGFSSDDIQIRKSLQVNNLWTVSFNQVYKGIEVLLTEVELRIRPDGKVMAFGTDYYKDINLETTQTISNSDILINAVAGLNYSDKKDMVQSTGEQFILPVRYSNSVSYHLTTKVLIDNPEDNQKFESYVDLQSGELIWRRNLLTNVETPIRVKAGIKKNSRLDTEADEVLNNFKLSINGKPHYTNGSGILTADFSAPVKGSGVMEGLYAKVVHQNITNASTTFSIVPGEENEINWTDSNSHRYERYLYYYANHARDYYVMIDSNSKAMDFQLKVTISNSGSANAYSETSNGNITFIGVASAGYYFVESPSILYHEYGHSVNTRLYKELGISTGMINMACHEATADLNAGLMTNEPRVGYLAFSDTTKIIRNLLNNYQYPRDIIGESHHDGQILGGAFWDLKLATNLDYVRWLVHHTKKMGTPDDLNTGVAYNEWFIEALITDDSYGDGDNDLSNGTPNALEIIKAFNRHKIGSDLAMMLTYQHTPLEDTDETANPYNVDFSLLNTLTFLNSKPGNVKVIYTTDNFKTTMSADAIETDNGVYLAQIPAQKRGTYVQYYMTAIDPGSNEVLKFSRDLLNFKPYSFLVGYKLGAEMNFDVSDGWSFSAPSDNATKGRWEIAYPQKAVYAGRMLLQPDTNPDGIKSKCLVTGATGGTNTQILINNMPNGNTSAISPTFDISSTVNPVLKFYKFYSNNLLFQLSNWKTFVSSNAGSTWIMVENSSQSYDDWTKMVFYLDDYVSKTKNFRIKFLFEQITSQGYPGSFSEGLVDNLQILSANDEPGVTKVDDLNNDNYVSVYPNPTSDFINLKLPQNEEIIGITITSILGNELITISNPGNNNYLTIQLLDHNGNQLGKGMYFVTTKTKNNTYKNKFIVE